MSRVFHQPNVTCLLVCNSVRRGQNVQNEIRRKGLFLQMLLHTNVTAVCSSGSRKENTHLSMWNQNDQSSHQRVKTLCIIPYIFLKTKAEEGLQTSDLQSWSTDLWFVTSNAILAWLLCKFLTQLCFGDVLDCWLKWCLWLNPLFS